MDTPFLKGKKVILRGLEKADLKSVAQWLNDPVVTHFMHMGVKPTYVEMLEEEWEKQVRGNHEIPFAICDAKKGKLIGWGGLYEINWISRLAEYRVFIGDRKYWNKGCGTESAELIVRYAFDKLNLHKVWLGVTADNVGAVRSYEKAGFKREGLFKEHIYRNNRYYDGIRMAILRKEHRSK